jgi:hypothetical protein
MGRVEYKTKKSFEVRPYKFKELPILYHVSAPTLRKWLLAINAKITLNGGYYTITQMETITEYLGIPYLIYDIDYADDNSDKKEFENPFQVRPYKWKELCDLYGVCPRTLKRWLHPFREELGKLKGGYYLIPQIEIIINKIGLPYFIYQREEDENKIAG